MNIDAKIQKVKDLGEGSHANCWGTTLYLLGANPSLKWEQYIPTTFFLNKCSKIITESNYKKGDILVLKNNGSTVHTAIYVGRGKWFHKAGSLAPCNSYLPTIVNFFNFCSNEYEVRRLDDSKILNYKVFSDMKKYVRIDYDDFAKI